ncbi:MAG: hypothetical protein AAF804_03090 [Bacteroidota bacterium]
MPFELPLEVIFAFVIEAIMQLLVIGLVGGWISRQFTRRQKRKEIQLKLIQDLTRIQGAFWSLRFRFNTLHLHRQPGQLAPITDSLSTEQIQAQKWASYEEACHLIGEYQGVKPLISEYFPDQQAQAGQLHQHYQTWRRSIRSDHPILQTDSGQSDPALQEIRSLFELMMQKMRKKL